MNDDNLAFIKAFQEHIRKNNIGSYKPTEERNFSKFNYKFVELPLDTLYLQEYINDLLLIYNTVSIQKTKDSYYLKLEGRKDKVGEY